MDPSGVERSFAVSLNRVAPEPGEGTVRAVLAAGYAKRLKKAP